MNKLGVLDIFCGAGGFSEGFRQEGFEIIRGIDRWQPAVETFNHNFGPRGEQKDALAFLRSSSLIDALPDTEIIIGSPPCVTFSSSNNSGKADKSSGIELTKSFLRIVAVKKWKIGSILQGWFMENVPRSITHLEDSYTFTGLELTQWALERGINPDQTALRLDVNRSVLNSADYGCAQTRKRAITGEIISRGIMVFPQRTHSEKPSSGELPWRSLSDLRADFPTPFDTGIQQAVRDPNYKELDILPEFLTDHFYDTGLYKCEWETSKYLKTNHPYMGRMSFPEDESRPSRTITATKIGSSRESIVYRSELCRSGNGEFRTATVREAACVMGFPITYQFKGSEGTKWRLVGNAVCPSISRALARQVKIELGLSLLGSPQVQKNAKISDVFNLNSPVCRDFKSPPRRKENSRFRRHPFKDGNMTVTMSNYDIGSNVPHLGRWATSVQYGTGDGFPNLIIRDGEFKRIEPAIRKQKQGSEFLEVIKNGFSEKIASSFELQNFYEQRVSSSQYLEPTELIDEIVRHIEQLGIGTDLFNQDEGGIFFKGKKEVPLKQLFALYAINRITSLANIKNYG